MAKKKKGRPGRPVGSKTEPRVEVIREPSACPRCGSTRQGRCTITREQEHAGIYRGRPYTHIVRRWRRCPNCGQAIVERSYENRKPSCPD